MDETKRSSKELPVMSFARRQDWVDWLDQNHTSSAGLWLQIARTSSMVASVTYPEALEAALIYGWIDGTKKSHDETTWLQKFTPRGPGSRWSKINREKAEALIRSGEMKPAGLQAVEQAKQNGAWEAAYDSPSQASVPADFQAALDQDPAAKAFFETLNSRNRYAIFYQIQTAKKPETRARRIEQFITMLANQEKLYP
jgi:uncharacterized protein YdeI (YjbR/CyaY-like superfamily)